MVYTRAVLIVTLLVITWATAVRAAAANIYPDAFNTLFTEWVDRYGLDTRFDIGHGQVEFVEKALAILLLAAKLPAFARYKNITYAKVKKLFSKRKRSTTYDMSATKKAYEASDGRKAKLKANRKKYNMSAVREAYEASAVRKAQKKKHQKSAPNKLYMKLYREQKQKAESLARKKRLASDPKLAQDVFSAEQIADFCVSWLNSKADPRTGYYGIYLNLIKKQWVQASHGFYFGITSLLEILKEGFKWARPRNYTVPVITRPGGTLISEKELQEELGFILIEVGKFRLKDTAADVERYLQTFLHNYTGDYGDDGILHRRMGIQLHKALAGDFGEYGDRELWSVFVAVGRITRSNYALPFKDPKRLDIEFNGVAVKMVKGNKTHVPKRSKYIINGIFKRPTSSRRRAAKAKKALEDEEDAGVTRGGKKRRTSLAAA